MNTFKEHVKNRTKTRQLEINNDNYSINPPYEKHLTKETYEQLENLKTVAINKGRAIAKDFYSRNFDRDRRAIEMCFVSSFREIKYLLECLCVDNEIRELLEMLYSILYKESSTFEVRAYPSASNYPSSNGTFSAIMFDIENDNDLLNETLCYNVVTGFNQNRNGSNFLSKFFQLPHVRYILNAFLFEAMSTPIIKYWYRCEKDYRLLMPTGSDIRVIRLLKHDSYIDDIEEWLDNYHKGEFTLTKKDGNNVVGGECAELFVELNGSKVKYCIFYNRNKALASLIYENRQAEQLIFTALNESDKKEIIKILYARLITDTIVFNFGVYNKQYPLYSVDWKWFLTAVGIPTDIIDLSDDNFMFEIEQNNRLLIQMLQDYQNN